MENALSILSELEALDVKLTGEGGGLRYSAPAGVLTPAMLKRIASEKEQLLAILKRRQDEQIWEERPIPRQLREKGLPLSTAQQRFWFLDRLDRGNSAVFVMPPIVLRMSGELNVQALERSLNEVVQRHEILRSAFRLEGDVPVQVALDDVSLTLIQRDLSAETRASS
jgi:hypothetical protein